MFRYAELCRCLYRSNRRFHKATPIQIAAGRIFTEPHHVIARHNDHHRKLAAAIVTVWQIIAVMDVTVRAGENLLCKQASLNRLRCFGGKENGIVPQAWYPLGHGDKALLEEPLFAELGKKYGKSAPQIILRWHIQSSNIVIPGSKNPDHIKSNFDLFDFALTDDEMAQITALNKNVRYYTSTPEMLKKYAEMVPPVDEQK